MKPAGARPKRTAVSSSKIALDGPNLRRKLEDNTSTRFRVRRVAGQGIPTALWLATRY